MRIIKINNCLECPYFVENIFDELRCTLLKETLPFTLRGAKTNIYKDCPLEITRRENDRR